MTNFLIKIVTPIVALFIEILYKFFYNYKIIGDILELAYDYFAYCYVITTF
jgi:hypothetical protein